MLTRIIIVTFFSLLFTAGHSQCTSTDAFIEKEFVIVLSTSNYEAALTMAKSASAKLQYKLDLRGLKKDSASGLTWNKKECEDEWGDFPCYVARGRYDDGNYVSIEYSDAFSGFHEGYYIVIISSWCKGGTQTKTSLTKAKKFYKDAYAKVTKVYLGCMH